MGGLEGEQDSARDRPAHTAYPQKQTTPQGTLMTNTPVTTPPTAAVADLDAIPAVQCPCGWAQRAFGDVPGAPASVHRVEILDDARTHYHKAHTETYYILECGPDAAIELDGERVPVRRGVAVMIPPGVRHRAVGRMTILNVVVPAFDPADEWFDDMPSEPEA